jgi:hypothetical protein
MSTYTDAGTGIWESQCSDEREAYLNEMLDENRFRDAREDTLYKFHDATKLLTTKATEAFAKMWAKSFMDADTDDHESIKLAKELDLDWEDAYLILWMREDYFKSLDMRNPNWWMQVSSDYDIED